MMKEQKSIKQYFEFYESVKEQNSPLKSFTFLDRGLSIVRYLKKYKKEIIENINYAFYESDEKYLVSFFSGERAKYVHINSTLTKDYPSIYENEQEYENYLSIYATFGILINQSFQLQSLNDTRFYHKDFIRDMTNVIFYDEMFRLNLERDLQVKDEILPLVYRYGNDFLFNLFKNSLNEECFMKNILFLNGIDSFLAQKLFNFYKNRIKKWKMTNI